MSVTQTVDIPDTYQLTIDVPRELPVGRTILTFTPAVQAKEESAELSLGKQRGFGCAKGQFWMADDFDAPLEDFKDYM